MDCPKCGTWNPDDKRVCWRCQADLPKPVEKKKRRPTVFLGLPVWAWVMLGRDGGLLAHYPVCRLRADRPLSNPMIHERRTLALPASVFAVAKT